tara:strand:- start:1064 stop:1852 length:789 start_codon:yes stop_codon:yes gene_type:complete
MANYFTKSFKPDIINGDVSNVIASNKTDAPFAASDILFDWQAVDIPVKTTAIVGGNIHCFGEDGGTQGNHDIMLIIAKSKDGVAPTSLGAVNAAVSGCYELPEIVLGVMKFEGGANRVHVLNYAFGSVYYYGGTGNNGQTGPVIIEPEPNPGLSGSAELNRIYVAGLAGGGLDFSTGVLANAATSDGDSASVVVKTVDPRKCFRPGDVVYIHDVDTPVGTVSSLTDNDIILTAAQVGAIAEDDEFMNATPITVNLSFERVVR